MRRFIRGSHGQATPPSCARRRASAPAFDLEVSQVGGWQQRLAVRHFNGLQKPIAESAPRPIHASPLGVLVAARHTQARDWRQLLMPQEDPAGAVSA